MAWAMAAEEAEEQVFLLLHALSVLQDSVNVSRDGAAVDAKGSASLCWDYTEQYDKADTLLGGSADVDGDRCKFYSGRTAECGNWDDDDFLAKEMCCSCGGGSTYQGKRKLAVNQASVFLSEGNDCPPGFTAINSVAACRAALDLVGLVGEDFGGTESDPSWPQGCYHCSTNADCQGIWFNKLGIGAGQTVTGTRRFCHAHYDASAVDVLFVGDSDVDYWDSSVTFPGSFNVGIGGYTTVNVLNEVGWWSDVNPKWVVIVAGENDLSTSRGPTNAAFERFKEIVKAFIGGGARVIYLGTKVEPANKKLWGEYMYYDEEIRKFAREQKQGEFQMIDVFRAFTNQMKNNKPGLDNKGKKATWTQLYASDSVHMSRLGYKLWNDWVRIAMDSEKLCIRWANGVCVEESTPVLTPAAS